MSSEEEFLQQSVKKLFGEIYNYQVNSPDVPKETLKEQLFDKLKEYDNEFYKKYNKIPMAEIAHQMASQENYRDLPEANAIQSNLMRNTFVSDAGYLTRYQRLHKLTSSGEPPQPVPVPPPAPARNYENEFIDNRYQFRDLNLNQKAHLINKSAGVTSILDKRDQYLTDLEGNKYQQDILTLMKQPQIVGDDGQPTIENHKMQIQKLGGIEDTIGAMEKSLNNFQKSASIPLSRIQGGTQSQSGPFKYQQLNQRSGNDTFLKEYSQKVKPNGETSLVEKSRQLREEMMRKLNQQ